MTERTIDYAVPAADPLAGRRIFFAAIVLALLACGALFLPGVREPEAEPLPGGRRGVPAA